MDIISLEFAFLALGSAFIYYLISHKYRVIYLAVLSSAFLVSFHYTLLAYVLAYSLVNFFIGLWIPRVNKKLILYRIGVGINLFQLIIFHYASFAIDPFFDSINSGVQVSKISTIIVTLGISYFSLQGIGYLINVKMGWEKPEKQFQNFFLYLIFFPKFLSGPIERSNHFLSQLKSLVVIDSKNISTGLRIALYGFFQKIAIANQIAPFVQSTFLNLKSADGTTLVLLLLILPLYLYFDFSGYTNIAIGFSKLFGIDLLPNFNRPFFSENMTAFWKRFHISLSSWFNDYIFRQISFRRRKWGTYASVYALLVTWVLFGIWHGAGWNFMLLGLLQAVAIIYEFFTKKWRIKIFSFMSPAVRKWFGRIATYIFYGGSLVFFFSPDLSSTLLFYSNIFEFSGSVLPIIIENIPLSAIGFIMMILFMEMIQEDFEAVSIRLEKWFLAESSYSRLVRWIFYSLVLSIIFVLGSSIQHFIYVQF